MSSLKKILSGCKTLAIALCAMATIHAVAQTGSIKGSVADPSGAVVQGAKVAALPAGKAVPAAAAASDANGVFLLKGLKPGAYSLQISAPGFKTTSVANVAVADGQTAAVAAKLALAPVSSEVRVIDTTAPSGSYNVPVASIGPLGEKETLDTPFTINTIPTNLMENQGSRTFSDALKYMPFAQMEARGGMDAGRPQTRGFEGTVIQNSRQDGLNVIDTTSYPMEMYDRIEVQNGVVGLYGPGQPSGMFNFILKRPTPTQTFNVNIFNDSPTLTGFNADLGGPITKYFGYRIDALHANGTAYAPDSHRRRELFSGALDFNITPHTVLQLNGSTYSDHFLGYPAGFTYDCALSAASSTSGCYQSTNTKLPSAPSAQVAGYGQPWAGQDLYTHTISANLRQGFGRNWNLTVGGLHQSAERNISNVSNYFSDNAGGYKVYLGPTWNTFYSDANVAHMNGHFKTGKFTHDAVIGTNGYVWRNDTVYWYNSKTAKNTSGQQSVYVGASNLYAPSFLTAVKGSAFLGTFKSFTDFAQTIVFADTVSYGRWMASFIGSYNWYKNTNFGGTGGSDFGNIVVNTTTSPVDSENGFSPSVTLSYKPDSASSIYFNFAQSIYPGDNNNNGSSSPVQEPFYRSNQYELGYKLQYRGAEATVAAFRMDRPYQAPTSVVSGITYYSIIGDQVNDGVDVMIKGKLPANLNVFGGFTWVDPQLQGSGYATTNGKQVVGVPRIQSNLLIEEQVQQVRGLALNLNWHYTGQRAGDTTNVIWVPSYATVDLGARYEHNVKYGDLTLRITASNIANQNYWASVFPGSINGLATTSYSAFLGTPRIISTSAMYRFGKGK